VKNVKIGEMQHRVEWLSVSTNPISETNRQLKPVQTSQGWFWARVKPMSGDETPKNSGQELRADVTHQIVMRNVGAIKPTDILKFKGRNLQVVSVLNVDENDSELLIMAKEVASVG